MSTQADLLSLNRTSLYDKPVGPSEEELRLRRRIDEIYTERPVSGSRYITAILSREGWDRNLSEYPTASRISVPAAQHTGQLQQPRVGHRYQLYPNYHPFWWEEQPNQ